MALDPTTAIGKVRLRVGDFTDLPYFSDTVYQSVLDENTGDIVKSSRTMAQYILAKLTTRVHQKLSQLEVYGEQYFKNYKEFLKNTLNNPWFMEDYPITYVGGSETTHPIIQFQKDWNANYYRGTESDALNQSAWSY